MAFMPPSPASRRRHRGRGVIVLDNVTASAVSNNGILTPDTSASSLEATPSPDEMVIAARGRKALPLTFSPDVHLTPVRQRNRGVSSLVKSSGWPTPPNAVTRLLLPTRTSPRKRLTLTDSPPGSSRVPSSATTPSPSPDKTLKRTSPISKRCRTSIGAALSDATADDSDPTVKLKGLTQEQLVTLLTTVMQRRPEVKADVRECMPQPDLQAMEDALNYFKRNIFKSLPNTRLESKTDSLAYNRVSTHLLAFKKAILDQGKKLCDAQAWSAVMDHSFMAWGYIRQTPIWDNQPHNNVRRQCFKAVAANCLLATKKGLWNPEICQQLKNKLLIMEKDSDDIGPCIKQMDLVINNGNLSTLQLDTNET